MRKLLLAAVIALLSLSCGPSDSGPPDCDEGFEVETNECVDVNECATAADDCDANAACSNTPGSFTCTCATGYEGDGRTCTDIDECTLGTDECDTNAACANTLGGHDCTCDAGYEGTGTVCTDIDECAAATDDCYVHDRCLNTTGGFSCQPAPSCTRDSDCPGESCAIVAAADGLQLNRVCSPGAGASSGADCTTNAECQSGVCVEGFCAQPCVDGGDCAVDQRCQEESFTSNALEGTFDVCRTFAAEFCDSSRDCTEGARVCGEVAGSRSYCAFPNEAGAEIGAACTEGTECSDNLCLTDLNDSCSVVCDDAVEDCPEGHACTETDLDDNDFRVCAATCADDEACAAGQVCAANLDTDKNSYDTICRSPIGATAVGQSCSLDGDCRSGLCNVFGSIDESCSGPFGDCSHFGETCAEVPDLGWRCVTPIRLCTEVCDGDDDCDVGALSHCTGTRYFPLAGGGDQPISVCGQFP